MTSPVARPPAPPTSIAWHGAPSLIPKRLPRYLGPQNIWSSGELLSSCGFPAWFAELPRCVDSRPTSATMTCAAKRGDNCAAMSVRNIVAVGAMGITGTMPMSLVLRSSSTQRMGQLKGRPRILRSNCCWFGWSQDPAFPGHPILTTFRESLCHRVVTIQFVAGCHC